jgi:hypothetical protein
VSLEIDGLAGAAALAQAEAGRPGQRLGLSVPPPPFMTAAEQIAQEVVREECIQALEARQPDWARVMKLMAEFEPAKRAIIAANPPKDGPGDGYVVAVVILVFMAVGAGIHEIGLRLWAAF